MSSYGGDGGEIRTEPMSDEVDESDEAERTRLEERERTFGRF